VIGIVLASDIRNPAEREGDAVSKRICGLLCKVGAAIITGALTVALPGAAQQLTNDKLSLTVDAQAGSYQLRARGGQPIFTTLVAAQVDHQWLRSSEYPHHQASESPFSDELGSGWAVTVTCTGLEGKADLVYVVQLYDQRDYATVQVTVRNTAAAPSPRSTPSWQVRTRSSAGTRSAAGGPHLQRGK
jgi:hypothetical protein